MGMAVWVISTKQPDNSPANSISQNESYQELNFIIHSTMPMAALSLLRNGELRHLVFSRPTSESLGEDTTYFSKDSSYPGIQVLYGV
jgi:hypothetical protein